MEQRPPFSRDRTAEGRTFGRPSRGVRNARVTKDRFCKGMSAANVITDEASIPVAARTAAPPRRWPARRVHLLSRTVILSLVALSFTGLLIVPATWWAWTLDVLLRSWLAFIGTVMAHEGVHGLLGRTRRTNDLWGRLALLPVLVPFTNFRGTHLRHHRHTNEPGKDPDLFLDTPHKWQLP